MIFPIFGGDDDFPLLSLENPLGQRVFLFFDGEAGEISEVLDLHGGGAFGIRHRSTRVGALAVVVRVMLMPPKAAVQKPAIYEERDSDSYSDCGNESKNDIE